MPKYMRERERGLEGEGGVEEERREGEKVRNSLVSLYVLQQ